MRDGLKLAYFHSHRHTIATELAIREAGPELRSALQGHTVPEGGENAHRYAKTRQQSQILRHIVEEHLLDYVALLDEVMAMKISQARAGAHRPRNPRLSPSGAAIASG
jgi:hypothetical protein